MSNNIKGGRSGPGGFIPLDYNASAMWYNSVSPSALNGVHDNASYYMFARYLFQDVMSQFRWKMPDLWPENFVLPTLYGYGYFVVVNTDRFGVIPQRATLGGRNVFYLPSYAHIVNPLIQTDRDLIIGRDCEVVFLQPDYCGVLDLVNRYAEQMALAAEAASMNLMAAKIAYIFFTKNLNAAESFKKIVDQIQAGNPFVFSDKDLFDPASGEQTWLKFDNDLRNIFITPDLLETIRTLKSNFDSEIGIPNANTTKKERMITDEVNSNRVETYSKAAMWLENLQKCCRKVNNLFGTDLSVDWRFPPEVMNNGPDYNPSDDV